MAPIIWCSSTPSRLLPPSDPSTTISRRHDPSDPVRGPFTRVIVIVLDGVGVGALPDAGAYGDAGSDTLGNVARQVPLRIPTLRSLGLDRVASIGAPGTPVPCGAYGRMAESSAGKDSVTGHWE